MKKKILHLVYSGLGGSTNVAFEIILNNKKKLKNKWKDQLILSGNYLQESYLSLIKKNRINYKFNKTKKFFSIFYGLRVFFYLIQLKPDMILIHNYDILPAFLYSSIFRKKIIYVDHIPLNLKNKIKYFLASIISGFFCDIIVVLNKENKNFFLKKNFKKIKFITNGIKIIKYRKKKKKKKILKIGMAARINETKDHEQLIEVMSQEFFKKINFRLYLAGIGEKTNYLLKKVKLLKLEKKIIFLGLLNREELSKFYNRLDLYVQATKGEAMSMSIIEAMNFNIPVLSSYVAGTKEILNPKKKIGIFFRDNFSLKKNLLLFNKMSLKNRNLISYCQKRHLKKFYSSDLMIDKYSELIQKKL